MMLTDLLNNLKKNNILLWAKADDRLGFSVDKDIGFDADLKAEVAARKDELLALLQDNGVTSEQFAKETSFLRLPPSSWPLALDSIQQGMYLQSDIDGLPYTYTVPLFIGLPQVDIARLRNALQTFLRHQPLLRQSIDSDMKRVFLAPEQFALEVERISWSELESKKRALAQQTFPMPEGQFARFVLLVRAETQEAVLACVHHHMLSDAPSVQHFAHQLLSAYATPSVSAQPEAGYLDYSAYQQWRVRQDDVQAFRTSLAARLNQAEPPALRQRHLSGVENRAFAVQAGLTSEVVERLTQACGERGLTLYSLLFTTFAHVLRTFSGQDSDFPIGLTVMNRPEAFSRAIGPFISTLPVIAALRADQSVLSNVKSIQHDILQLQEHPWVNIGHLAPEIDGGAVRINELVQLLFTFHNFENGDIAVPGVEYRLEPYPDLAEKFGMSLFAAQRDGQIDFTLTAAENRYEEDYVRNILEALVYALGQFDRQSWETPLEQIDLITPAQRRQVLSEWNDTRCDYSEDEHIASLLEAQVALTPDNIACADRHRQLTYRQLNLQANQLAAALSSRGVGHGACVALCLDRSVELLVGIWAILKLGAAYLPVDPAFPDDRLDYILQDSRADVIICHQAYRHRVAAPGRRLVVLDDESLRHELELLSDENMARQISPNDLAYVIYTSGTTGQPKGVMCTHRGLINRIQWMNKSYPLTAADRVLQKTPYIFDVSVWELIWASLYGANIVFADPDGHKDADYLIELIERETITVLHFVPSMLAAFTETLQGIQRDRNVSLPSLRYVFCSGEELKLTQVKGIKQCLPHIALHNLYGPTEASIDVLYFDCNDPDIDNVLIGRPIDNMKVLVLDKGQRLLPPGAVGELYLSGVGLARGYLNKAALTAEKFIVNPYCTEWDERADDYACLYKTGDLVYQRNDGQIVYVGRNDFQVKIRGYRIELGEIAQRLEAFDLVRQAVALVYQQPHPRLVAYYTAQAPLPEATLQHFLAAALPEYMVPETFIWLKEWPVTVNGKLDRRALPEPSLPVVQERVAPQSEREAQIAAIVAEMMGIDEAHFSCEANLYQLGLDSIMAIKLVSKLRQAMGVSIRVKDVFASKTVHALHLRLAQHQQQVMIEGKREQGVLVGELPLLPVQRWFFDCAFPYPSYWNQAFLLDVPALDVERLREALHALIQHHDALRLTFTSEDSSHWRQGYQPMTDAIELRCHHVERSAPQWQEALSAVLTEWQSDIDLADGPLYRFGYVTGFDEGRARIFCACHHLVLDSVSWGILARDLANAYHGESLGDKGTSYRQWTEHFEQYCANHAEEASYWRARMADYRPVALPAARGATMACSRLALSIKVTQALQTEGLRAFNAKVDECLLACADGMLAHWFNGELTHVTVEGHGREEIDAALDVHRCVGWFTSLYPCALSSSPDPAMRLQAAKAQLRGVPHQGVGFGAFARELGLPLPNVCFNYLGQLTSPDEKDWALVMSPVGKTRHPDNGLPFGITLFSYIEQGRLQLEVVSGLSGEQNQQLLEAWEAAIDTLIACCERQGRTQYGLGDFINVADERDLQHLPLQGGAENGDCFAMTEIQKAYLVGRFENYEIGNVANHIYNEFVYPRLDDERLELAINRLIALCPVLRTVYDAESMTQRFISVSQAGHYALAVNDLRLDDEATALARVRKRLSHQVYQVDRFPLFTFEISRLRDRDVLHISLDLILLDVQSRLALYQLLNALYRGNVLPPLATVNFKDYQEHLAHLKASRWYQRDCAYWQDKLADMPLRPNLPLKVPSATVEHPRFAEHTLYIDKQIWQDFKRQAQHYQVSYSSVLLSLYGYLIARYSGNSEFLITMTLFNRYAVCEDVNDILGDFTSTNLFHFRDAGEDLFTTIETTHKRMWDDIQHALYSGLDVQRDLVKLHGLDRHSAVSPLVFTGVVGQQTGDWDKQAYLEDSEVREQRYWCAQTSQAWIDLQAIEVDGRFMSKWLYVDQLFDEETIAHLNRAYCRLISLLAQQPWETPVGCENYLPEAQREMMQRANAVTQPLSEETLFSAFDLLATQARHRETIAVYDGEAAIGMTYGQLKQDSDALAQQGMGSSAPLIAVLAEKSYAQVCACLAIMKAGKGYLPLHVEWPAGRIADILQQAGVEQLWLTRAQSARVDIRTLSEAGYQLLVIEDMLDEATALPPCFGLPHVSAADVAYVIFTSGSTGRPKGVTIDHRGAVNTLQAVNRRLSLTAEDALFALSELSFDLSVYDIFGALSVGAEIVLPAQESVKDPERWLPLLAEREVTVWNSVPQLAGLLADAVARQGCSLPRLRAFLMSGDWIPLNLPETLRTLWPHADCISLGGATEGSIWSVWYPIEAIDPAWRSIPYGTAMPHQALYVLDPQGQMCPVGVTGELYLGGMGVALNYWRNPQLTAERFISHPRHGRLYKTGDLGRWHAAGYVEFLGRNDFQVKLRGHRIELGEIESRLLQCGGIHQAVALVMAQPAPMLVAYYVGEANADEKMLRSRLAEQLPEYMVPAHLIALDALPLTANGKLDRNALPLPAAEEQATYCPPRDDREHQLCRLWGEILHVPADELSTQADLFQLGIDSIASIQMAGRLRRELQLDVTLKELLTYRTIASFYDTLLGRQTVGGIQTVQRETGALSGAVPLLPIQQWFLAHDLPHPQQWNQYGLLVAPGMTMARLQCLLPRLVAQHDAFNLRFEKDTQGEWRQCYQPQAALPPCHALDIRALSLPEDHPDFDAALLQRFADWQQAFDLQSGPLAAFAVLEGYADGKARVFVACHHLIVDAVSLQVIVDDLRRLSQEETLPEKASSYRQWVNHLRQRAQITSHEREEWLGQLPGSEVHALQALGGTATTRHALAWGEGPSCRLMQHLAMFGMQPQDMVAWAVGRVLHDLTGQTAFSLWFEGHGRQADERTLDISRTMGWFTSRYPVRFSYQRDAREHLLAVKNNLRRWSQRAENFGVLCGLPVVREDGISINYLGKMEAAGDWALDHHFVGLHRHASQEGTHLIDIVVLNVGDRLELRVESRLREHDAAWLTQRLIRELEDGLVSMNWPSWRWLTESDVDFALPQPHLDRLQHAQAVDAVFMANSLQQGMLHHSLAFGDADRVYRVATRWDYHCAIEPETFKRAWQWVQQQFSCLRLRFDWRGEIVQVVDHEGRFPWHVHDISHLSPEEREHALHRLQESEQQASFDLQQSGLYRVCLVKLADDHFACLFCVHHAILDGWSSPLLVGALHDAYLAFSHGREPADRPDLFASVQRYIQRHRDRDTDFWRDYLSSVDTSPDLSGWRRPDAESSALAAIKSVSAAGICRCELSAEERRCALEAAQRQGMTLNALLQYAWHKVLALYSGAAVTVVGTVVAGRMLPLNGIENTLGMFLNTLPLKVEHQSDEPLIQQAHRLQQDINEANTRCLVDLAHLQPAGQRLFDSLFIYENYPQPDEDRHRELRHQFVGRNEQRDYPLVVSVEEEPDVLLIKLEYAAEYFDAAMMRQAMALLKDIVGHMAKDASTETVAIAPVYCEPEQPLLLPAPGNAATLSQVLAHYACSRSDAPALSDGERSWSYAQLDAEVTQLANLIAGRLEKTPHAPIALRLHSKVLTVMALLAIGRLGAAYVPLDKDYPQERIDFILRDSQAIAVLTMSGDEGAEYGIPSIPLFGTAGEALWRKQATMPTFTPAAEKTAYILYTSGTTGKPKGVSVGHGALLATLRGFWQQYFQGREALKTYSMTNPVFDIFGLEYGLPLLSGGCVTLGTHHVTGLDCRKFDFIQSTPSMLEIVLPVLQGDEECLLLVGGEKLEPHLAQKALAVFTALVNVYGPTETCIWSTGKHYRRAATDRVLTIGRPLPGERCLVLDPAGRPLPVGAIGELYIGGSGVAEGYHNQPELTASRFVSLSFAEGIWYRSGDRARILPNREIAFLGRQDQQVKLYGHRIEKGEIEQVILQHESILQVTVQICQVAGDGNVGQALVAYYVAQGEINAGQLNEHVGRQLPGYMVPAYWIALSALPLNANGKLDVRALPSVDAGEASPAAQSEIATPLVKQLQVIWQELLGCEAVGVNTSFFELGGNSIMLTRLYGMLPDQVQQKIGLIDLFRLPTIARIAAHIEGRQHEAAPAPTTGPINARDDIAIVGMAGRFPGAQTLAAFWQRLCDGEAFITHYSRDALAASVDSALLDHPHYVRAQGMLDDIDRFDADFFGCTAQEARLMDPQQRIFLECAWHALEDANCDPQRFAGDIGVYAAIGNSNYERDVVLPNMPQADLIDHYQLMIHNQSHFLATKTAYKLNLTGPAMTIQTACSSSLVAVHQACRALQAGDCQVALAGGISIGQLARGGYLYQPGMIFSPDGHCRPFDAQAAGTIEGQGVGIVVLKPLAQALADGDAVYAVVKGSAVNNDGRDKMGFTAPSESRQQAVIAKALADADVTPADISYVEAHGTGTPLGDPIEIAGLKAAFAGQQAEHACAIGSVKSNLGHLDVAAGIAGLIKTALCLQHRTLVPTLHMQRENPALKLAEGPFYVNVETRNWESATGLRTAGVSAFGIGGTNAHVILQQAPNTPTTAPRSAQRNMLCVSAADDAALERMSEALADHLATHPEHSMEAVGYALMAQRHRYACQRWVSGDSREAVVARLREKGETMARPAFEAQVAFMFPGQGAQFVGMTQALYDAEPQFRVEVDRCLALLEPMMGGEITREDVLANGESVHHTAITQVALFVYEYALAQWYRFLGVEPTVMIGHSLGEYVAACIAGVFSLEDALKLMLKRGALLAHTAPGAMLAIKQSAEGVSEQAAALGVDIAVVNDSGSCVISGAASAIASLQASLIAQGVSCHPVKVSHAFHSRLLEPVLAEFKAALQEIAFNEPQLPFISNLTGQWATAEQVCQPEYWVQHLRHTVQYDAGLRTLLERRADDNWVLLEVGPRQILSTLASRHPALGNAAVVVSSPRNATDERQAAQMLWRSVGVLHMSGVEINQERFWRCTGQASLRLPAYPFAPQRHWFGVMNSPAHSRPAPVPAEAAVHQGDMQQRVAMLFNEVLGCESVDPQRGFFELGGDSLSALQLIGRLQKMTGIRLELMAMEQPSVVQIAQSLEAHATAKPQGESGLVKLRDGEDEGMMPLVLIHPIGGDIYFYRELAQCLGSSRTIYAIRSPLLNGSGAFESIEQLAGEYLALLEPHLERGECCLAGSSFGGIIAFEMARQYQEGKHVSLPVVMIDSPGQGNLPAAMTDEQILDYLLSFGLVSLDIDWDAWKAMTQMADKIHYLSEITKGTAAETLFSSAFLPRYLSTWQRHNVMMQRYHPHALMSDVLFFSHREVIADFPENQSKFWHPWVLGRFEVQVIPGNHLTMNAGEGAAMMAEKMTSWLGHWTLA
ncbi:Linear gramicidin synthase subunit D [Serratia marcescens]|uniref:non-ribosomal peptide synthetase/type I polyketide synthase n=1 Tax=Serratia marcescens TaxID=615 RepID=UPI0021775AE8|nr:non-ribosomal peptide synthetase/type I polyketide synthase [Serratia marcescens]CAI1711099.1 Linear gramicidin synthase subunit D [Serratia marcescens]